MRYVLDASALLALLLEETGADQVEEVLDFACIGAVNLAEAATVLARRPMSHEGVMAVLSEAPVTVLLADGSLGIAAGLLATTTRRAGSSLGDRFCLALAIRLEATMLTADRALAGIAPEVGVGVRLIR